MSWGGRRAQALLRLVLATYGTECCHCHRPIVFGLRPRHRLGPSAEHLLPRSMGGSDDLANLRPAHYGCNSARGARPLRSDRRAESGSGFFSAGRSDTPRPVSVPPQEA